MDKKIEELQTASSELVHRMEQLNAWMPDSASTHAKRLLSKVIQHSNEVECIAEELTNYVPKNEGCRCVELEEILELIPKKMGLGELLELKDLIHQHFNNHKHLTKYRG